VISEEHISMAETQPSTRHTSVAIIGTGFSGLGMAIALKRAGIGYVLFERRADLGGTWYDNTYPGCKCDVPSHLYSFSFALNPEWSQTYSPQPEIWAYLRRTAEEHGVVDDIRFDHEVRDACWDEAAACWRIETSHGSWTAGALVSGNGALSEPMIPEIAGLERFAGTVFHSATWNHEHDLRGERVAVIGTGASAIQFVPKIQPEVGQMYVFQRTPAWVLPHSDRPIREWEHRLYRTVPLAQRLARAFVYWSRELIAIPMTKRPDWAKVIEKAARAHLAKQVPDRSLREKLTPSFSPGCKRLLLSDDWYPALTQNNVEVVTDGISEIREHSIVTADGTEREVDTIIFGTGFQVTEFPLARQVRGLAGRSLSEAWAEHGAQAHLGTTVPGFPNLFLLAGPNTGIGHTSLVFMIEAQIDYILQALRAVQSHRAAAVDVRREACDRYNAELQRKMQHTVWNAGGCRSWYLDDKGRNVTLWPDFTWRFRLMTRRFDEEHYDFIPPPRRAPMDAPGVPATVGAGRDA
jgi:cation diffusion facilitator CzcD-associated flavoprotein CzcO